MTGYYLSIGYLSGYSWQGTPEEAWTLLVQTVERLRRDPDAIVAEAKRLGAPDWCERGCCTLLALARRYEANDGTLYIQDKPRPLEQKDDWKPYIVQFASGERTLKEAVRRAFCRLVIEAMHRQGLEVNLEVR